MSYDTICDNCGHRELVAPDKSGYIVELGWSSIEIAVMPTYHLRRLRDEEDPGPWEDERMDIEEPKRIDLSFTFERPECIVGFFASGKVQEQINAAITYQKEHTYKNWAGVSINREYRWEFVDGVAPEMKQEA